MFVNSGRFARILVFGKSCLFTATKTVERLTVIIHFLGEISLFTNRQCCKDKSRSLQKSI